MSYFGDTNISLFSHMAGGPVARCQFSKKGNLRFATCFRHGTARMERTTAWRMDGGGHIAGQNNAFPL